MCGIAGFWFPSQAGRDQDGGTIQRMLDKIVHRGPDDRGVKRYESRGLAMGHTRLSIVGLDHGHQPILADDGTLSREVMPDLLHLNESSYATWAKAMEPTLVKLIQE